MKQFVYRNLSLFGTDVYVDVKGYFWLDFAYENKYYKIKLVCLFN